MEVTRSELKARPTGPLSLRPVEGDPASSVKAGLVRDMPETIRSWGTPDGEALFPRFAETFTDKESAT